MTKSAKKPTSQLRMIPVGGITRFARVGASVYLTALSRGYDSMATPGTIFVEQSSEGGIINKKITYRRADMSLEVEQTLRALKFLRVVAMYVDESGNIRICGSPSYPLTLDYNSTAGGYEVTLTGTDSEPDGYWQR